MLTRYTIFRPGVAAYSADIDLAAEPSSHDLAAILQPVFDGARCERVAVLHEGKRADMFVDENGHAKGLPLNIEATTVYHAYARSRGRPIAEDAPVIVGPAVLFDRPVWS